MDPSAYYNTIIATSDCQPHPRLPLALIPSVAPRQQVSATEKSQPRFSATKGPKPWFSATEGPQASSQCYWRPPSTEAVLPKAPSLDSVLMKVPQPQISATEGQRRKKMAAVAVLRVLIFHSCAFFSSFFHALYLSFFGLFLVPFLTIFVN